MKKTKRALFPQLVLSSTVFFALLQGCTVFPDAAPARVYSLELLPALKSVKCEVRFVVREVSLPGFLDRAEIVLGRNEGALDINSQHLWAAPLGKEMTRVISQGLSERLLGSSLMPYPLRLTEMPDLLLQINLVRYTFSDQGLNLQFNVNGMRVDSKTLAFANLPIHAIGPFNRIVSSPRASEPSRASQIASALSVALNQAIDEISATIGARVCN
jgi:uncharacterized lipoprotein YmbA